MEIAALAIQYPITRFHVQVRLKKVVTQEVGLSFWKLSHPLVGSKLHTDKHTHARAHTERHLIQPLINILLPREGFHIWGPNYLHLIGPLRKLVSCSHLQGYYTRTRTHVHMHAWSLRANQCRDPWATWRAPSFHLSTSYSPVHPSLSAPSVPLPQSESLNPSTALGLLGFSFLDFDPLTDRKCVGVAMSHQRPQTPNGGQFISV